MGDKGSFTPSDSTVRKNDVSLRSDVECNYWIEFIISTALD